jgi:hypothetical protein
LSFAPRADARGEQHAHDAGESAGHRHFARAEQRHLGPAQTARGVRGEVGVEIGRRGEDGAHDARGIEPVGFEQRDQQARRGLPNVVGAVRGHLHRAAHRRDLVSPAAYARHASALRRPRREPDVRAGRAMHALDRPCMLAFARNEGQRSAR